MLNNSLFLNDTELPNALPNAELYNLIKEAQNGSENARNKILKHNIRFIMYIIDRYFSGCNFETKKDLVSVGVFGVMTAIDYYKGDRGLFSTLAAKCIKTSIIQYLTKQQKYQLVSTLSDKIKPHKEIDDLTLEGTIEDDEDFIEILEDKEQLKLVRKIMLEVIENLKGRDKEIAKLYFGIGVRYHEQVEIAEELGITRQAVSLRVQSIVSKISLYLKQEGIIETDVSLKANKRSDILSACDIDECTKSLSEYLSDSDGELREKTMSIIDKFPPVRKEVSLMYFGMKDRKYQLDEIIIHLGLNYTKTLDFIRKSTEDLIVQLGQAGFINIDFTSGNIKPAVKKISK